MIEYSVDDSRTLPMKSTAVCASRKTLRSKKEARITSGLGVCVSWGKVHSSRGLPLSFDREWIGERVRHEGVACEE
jgi:hypothetical protein